MVMDSAVLVGTYGAIIGLAIAIVLIIFKVHPAYSLIVGALFGGIIGLIGKEGMTFNSVFSNTISYMVSGAQGMVTTILRILTSGVLAGALIQTGSAEKIATVITKKLGDKLALVSIALSTMIICAVGVFIDIAVIIVAPIAIDIAKKTKLTKTAIIMSLIGGGKAGNIMSPNPNTTAIATEFNVDLTSLMARNIVPAIFALGVTILLAFLLQKKSKDFFEVKLETALDRTGNIIQDNDINKENPAIEDKENKNEEGNVSEQKSEENAVSNEDVKDDKKKDELPNIFLALLGPLVVIIILILRPTANIEIDPLIALPIGGLVTILVTKNYKKTLDITSFGIKKVGGITLLLLGTGTLAGIIKNSNLQNDIISLLDALNLPLFLLAPFSGFFFAAAVASTTSGSTIAASTFATKLTEGGINAVGAGAMMHASATILDSLPHGSFFHVTADSVGMDFKSRLKMIPFEALVGFTSTLVSVIIFLIFKK